MFALLPKITVYMYTGFEVAQGTERDLPFKS